MNRHVAYPKDKLVPRPLGLSMLRGFLCRCPNCGKGRLFGKFLKVVDRCSICHEEYFHHRADDAPAYFVIAIVGHIVVSAMFTVELAYMPPIWLQFAIWIPVTLILALVLLQPVKGTLVAVQWVYRMHGFNPGSSDE